MPRALAGLVLLAVSAGLGSAADAQTHEPRGLTFGQGGGFRYAPREHHVTVPSGRVYGPFDFGYPSYGSPIVAAPGIVVTWGYPVMYGTVVVPGDYWPQPLPLSRMPDSPLMPPANALPPHVGPWGDLPIPKPKTDPAERPVMPSSAAARLKALEWMAQGDQDFRQHLWQRAYANYRQAVNLADDLAEAHLRYGIVFAILRRYDRAQLHFRRAVFIDPSLPQSDFTLEKLFGPDSKLVRMSILARVADWANEDIADPARLFVLGVLMHFDQDERAQELFSAAFQLTGGASHIVAFLPRAAPQGSEEPPAIPPAPLPPPHPNGPDLPLPEE
jgi:hypothetical protein